jgi:hypothetical protein
MPTCAFTKKNTVEGVSLVAGAQEGETSSPLGVLIVMIAFNSLFFALSQQSLPNVSNFSNIGMKKTYTAGGCVCVCVCVYLCDDRRRFFLCLQGKESQMSRDYPL